MRVVRYTFDICIHKSYKHDVYTLSHVLEKHIMGCDGVCGCEVKESHAKLCNAVDIDKVIKAQDGLTLSTDGFKILTGEVE